MRYAVIANGKVRRILESKKEPKQRFPGHEVVSLEGLDNVEVGWQVHDRNADGKPTGFAAPVVRAMSAVYDQNMGEFVLPQDAPAEQAEEFARMKNQYEAQKELDALMSTPQGTATKRVERLEKFLTAKFGVEFK